MKAVDKAILLKGLGMDKIAEKLLRKKGGKDKLIKAIDTYRYATKEDIDSYSEELSRYDKRFVLQPIRDYNSLPPDNVLDELKKAKDNKCFDEFYIGYIEKVEDPILFGKITDFPTLHFYIAQWGDDVKIEDIIGVE